MNRFSKFLTLATFTVSLGAFAQSRGNPAADLVGRVGDLYSQVRSRAFGYDINTINALNTKLDEINQILYSPAPPSGDLRCVSRDNDGNNPWVIGIATDPVTVSKLPNTVVSTQAACQTTIQQSRRLDWDTTYICASKDNDGNNPYALVAISMSSRNSHQIANSVSSTQANCFQQLTDVQSSSSGLYFCGTRDNDGNAPYVKVLVRLDGSVTTGSETYSSYAACKAAP